MGKEYRIRIRGKQREDIDADLMAQFVVMLGRQLAEDARGAMEAARQVEAEDEQWEKPAEDDGQAQERAS